jgi:hypothetical protein
MVDMRWESPPDADRKAWARWKPMADALQEHPDKWALVVENADYRKMTSVRSCFSKYGCKVRIRKQPQDGGWNVWAMYPGV